MTVGSTSQPDPVEWHGTQVLRSKTALALLCFSGMLAAVLLVPSPLRDRMRSSSETVTAPVTGAPALPGLPSAPAVPGPTEAPTPAGLTMSSDKAEEPLQDPKRGMAAFYAALSRTESKKPGAITRVLHYGDSLIDLDFITAPVRRALQKRFGDAGHGFVLAAKPWRWYNQMDISLVSSKDCWDQFRLVGRRRRDGRLGLGCAAVESRRTCRTRVIMRKIKASRVDVHYLEMPRGGTLRVEIDGKRVGELKTAAEVKRSGFAMYKVPDVPHTIRLTARGKVRLFGVALERGEIGVTWENLPLVSARFHQLLRLNHKHWAEQLAHRRPDLVVFQFGANDTISFGGDINRYGRQVHQVLKLMRDTLPKSSCLVIGPLDRLTRDGKGRLSSPKVVRTVADKQRESAFKAGCAFWDGQKAMGGPGSMKRWLKRRWVLKDLVHLNVRGSNVFGAILERALMADYRRHKKR